MNLDIAEAKNLAKQLNEEIKQNKLEDLESVPLLLMFLICLWCDDVPLGQSRCGLYASIIELLLSRSICKYPEMELTCEPSHSDIPQCFCKHVHCTKYNKLLAALGQLAFETLYSVKKENTLVFDQSVAIKYLSPDYLKLSLLSGLLTQSKERTLTKQSSKVSFPHKTVQEFVCAFYISCQTESDIHKIVQQKCKSVQNILEILTVFVFISGMVNAEVLSSISRAFMFVIRDDKITSEYMSTTGRYCKPLKDIQDMYISCIKENPNDECLKHFCEDFFFMEDCKEDKYFTYLYWFAVDNKNSMGSINIDTRDGPSLLKIVDCCELGEPFNISKLFYIFHGEEAELIYLLNRPTKCVSVISWGEGSWTRKMTKTFQRNFLLQAIYIRGFAMSHDVLIDFLNYIINRKTMTEIILFDLSCTEHRRTCTFSLDFSQHSDLRKLVLYEIPEVSQLKINSQVKHMKLLCISLGEMSLPTEMVNIERVELWYVNMSATTFRDLVKVVEKLSHKLLVKVGDCNIEPKKEFEDVKQYIHASQNLNFRSTPDECSWFEFETNVV